MSFLEQTTRKVKRAKHSQWHWDWFCFHSWCRKWANSLFKCYIVLSENWCFHWLVAKFSFVFQLLNEFLFAFFFFLACLTLLFPMYSVHIYLKKESGKSDKTLITNRRHHRWGRERKQTVTEGIFSKNILRNAFLTSGETKEQKLNLKTLEWGDIRPIGNKTQICYWKFITNSYWYVHINKLISEAS